VGDEPGQDPRTLAERITESLPGLTGYVRRRLGGELSGKESVSDIVQSTCRELLRAASNFEDRGEASFEAWIRGAAENKIRNRARHWRAERRGKPTKSIDDTTTIIGRDSARPSGEAMLREEAERLERAFRALPDEYRDVLHRSQVQGETHAEIGTALDRSPEAVRKLVARAMARLSVELRPRGPGSVES
jgi:RNA polymerase sigma-70 factor (ECF subfamily)